MSTCPQHTASRTVTGTRMKFMVSLSLPGGLTMSEVPFTVSFFVYSNKARTFAKPDMDCVDENSYMVVVDTTGMGIGELRYQVEVTLPDGRVEIVKGTTAEMVADGLH